MGVVGQFSVGGRMLKSTSTHAMQNRVALLVCDKQITR
jgi:hypothetical protein